MLRGTAERLLKGQLEDFVLSRRKSGRSWQDIAQDLRDETEGVLDLSRETLRIWFSESVGGDELTNESSAPADFMGIETVALVAGISRGTIMKFLHQGELRGVHARGRWWIDPDSVQRFVDSVSMGEAAQIVQRPVATVRRWYDSGVVEGFRTTSGNRRVYRASLAKMIENGQRA